MTYKINSEDEYKLKFEQDNEILSILQNISLLLNTKKGTVPMHREFGLPMEFLDKPVDVAEAIAYAEISEALEEFEPRANLEDVTFERTDKGKIAVIVEVSIHGDDEESD